MTPIVNLPLTKCCIREMVARDRKSALRFNGWSSRDQRGGVR